MLSAVAPGAARGQPDGAPLPPFVHRPPAAFRNAPAAVRRALAARGCAVPQFADVREPHGVMRGQFDGRGAHDWAATCDRAGGAVVYVFWGGRAGRVDSLLAGHGRGRRGWLLSNAPAARIRRIQAGCCGGSAATLRRRFRHDGLEVAGSACCSTIYYWTGRRWLELMGAD